MAKADNHFRAARGRGFGQHIAFAHVDHRYFLFGFARCAAGCDIGGLLKRCRLVERSNLFRRGARVECDVPLRPLDYLTIRIVWQKR